MKMYQAEVLEKHTVVQHFYFGDILPWRKTGTSEPLPTHIVVSEEQEDNDDDFTTGQPVISKAPWVDAGDQHPVSTTVAPWAAMPTGTMPTTAAPWASRTSVPSNNRDVQATPTTSTLRQPARQYMHSLAQTGSAAAMTSPLGVLSQPITGKDTKRSPT